MWDLVGNPEDQFSHNEAHIVSPIYDYYDNMPILLFFTAVIMVIFDEKL